MKNNVFMPSAITLDMLIVIFTSLALIVDSSLFISEKCNDNGGTEFLVMFLESDRNGEPMRLFLNTNTDHQVTVSLTTPTWISAKTINLEVYVVAGNTTVVELPDDLRLKGTIIDNKVVHVIASDHITIHAASIQSYSGDAFIVYPVSILGEEYIAHSRNTSSSEYLVGIAPLNDHTIVEVKLPDGAHIVNGTKYTTGMVTTLHRFQVLQLRIENAQYVIIKANKIVSVNNGHVFENVNTMFGTTYDHTEEQILPIRLWSKEYIVAPSLPYLHDEYGENVRIYGYYNSTTVEIHRSSAKSDLKFKVSGEFHEFFIKPGEAAIIKSNKEIGVFQYGVSSPFPDMYHSEAYLMQVTGTDQYVRYVTFPVIYSSNNHFHSRIMIVASKNAINNIELNGGPITSLWRSSEGSDYYFTYVDVTESYNVLKTTDEYGLFTAVLSGVGSFIQYGLAAGKYLNKASRIDQDVGGRSDEKVSKFSWTLKDYVPSYAPSYAGPESFQECFRICHDIRSCGYIVFNSETSITCRIYTERASCSKRHYEIGSNVFTKM